MSHKTTIALALAAGFIGGIVSQRIMPAPVLAQEQTPVPREIRAHQFVLVDDTGVDRGIFGFAVSGKGAADADLELMNPSGYTWSFATSPRHPGMLPDATCQTCSRKPAKKNPAASSSGPASK
jgi:hypothetical protein